MPEKNLEDNIVACLLEAAEYRSDKDATISIRRGEKKLFEFKIESLDEDTWRRALRENTQNRGRRSEELNAMRYFSQLIYAATCPEDKERLWKNKEVQAKLNVASGVDVVNAVLTPGEKTRIVEALEKMSGYDEATLDDMIKN